MFDKTPPKDDTGYRLADQAMYYDFVHRPFEEQGIRAKKERDLFKKQMHGVVGDPKRSEERYISKIFDAGRGKSKDNGFCIGCDLDYNYRDLLMGVGECTRGALKGLPEETAKVT